jgi:hypothetical protein
MLIICHRGSRDQGTTLMLISCHRERVCLTHGRGQGTTLMLISCLLPAISM